VSLSGTSQTNPTFFLNWENGVNYSLTAQTPQYAVQTLQDLQNIPISGPTMTRPEILADVASITRANEMQVLSHYNIRRVVDIYGAVQDRDLGAVGRDITRIVDAHRPSLPRGSFITVRGQLQTMRASYLVQLVINTYSISGCESRCSSHDLGHGLGGPVERMGLLIPFLDELVDLCT
jgi:multidrug efflux pump subunit AcrB